MEVVAPMSSSQLIFEAVESEWLVTVLQADGSLVAWLLHRGGENLLAVVSILPHRLEWIFQNEMQLLNPHRVTLFQDRVYLSVEEIYAWKRGWTELGVDKQNNRTSWDCNRAPLSTTISNTIIELRSEFLTSINSILSTML